MAGLIGRKSLSGAVDGSDYDYTALVDEANDLADALIALTGITGVTDEDDLCIATSVQDQIGKLPNDGTLVDVDMVTTFATAIFNAFNPV